jgi:protein O-mannosyl-transferase
VEDAQFLHRRVIYRLVIGIHMLFRSWLTNVRTVAPVPASASAALAVMLYASSLDNPFVYDDFRLIVENPAIQNLSSVLSVLARDVTRPVVSLSYVADTALWGTGPFGYHLTNVLLHALNVVLAYWVGFVAADDWRRSGGGRYRLTPSPTIVATVTSVLTAAHPVMTQAVGYITARSELLYGAFFLASLLAARRWMRDTGWWRSIALALWVVALLAKEAAAMLPAVLWCYDAWVIAGDGDARWQRVKGLYAPMLAVVLLAGGARFALLAAEYPVGAGFDWPHAFASIDAFWQYLALFVRPRGQTIMHTVPFVAAVTPRIVAGALGLVALAAVIWSLRKVQGLVSLGLVVMVALLVPGSALFMAGIGEPMAEHRAYISAIGFFLACGAGAGLAWQAAVTHGRGTLLLRVSAGVIALQFMGLTIMRNEVWGSSVTLAEEAVTRSPDHWVPRLFLGETLRQTGRCAEAVPEYRAVLAQHGMTTFTRTQLLGCLLQTNQVADARAELLELPEANRRALCGVVPGTQCP